MLSHQVTNSSWVLEHSRGRLVMLCITQVFSSSIPAQTQNKETSTTSVSHFRLSASTIVLQAPTGVRISSHVFPAKTPIASFAKREFVFSEMDSTQILSFSPPLSNKLMVKESWIVDLVSPEPLQESVSLALLPLKMQQSMEFTSKRKSSVLLVPTGPFFIN